MTLGTRGPLVGVVLVTHGQGAAALVDAARAIIGNIAQLTPVCTQVGEPFESIVQKLSKGCDEVDAGAGVLFLVDVHGSTPFHASMAMLDGTRAAEVLCGVNLPMLMKLSTVDRQHISPMEVAEGLREVGRRSIRLGSELTGKVTIGETR
jgi:mannose PTS system EIIA component